MILGQCVRGDGLEVVGVDDAHATALHLLEERAAFHRTHKHHDLHGLDVGAGGDHVNGDGDARHGAVAELLDQLLGICARGPVSDLLAEVVSFVELLAHDMHDVLGVGVVLGEDEGFRHPGSARKNLA